MIRIWSDGSSNGKTGAPIGYAAVIDFGDDYLLDMAVWRDYGTNNVAELSGAILGLAACETDACLEYGVTVYTDSMYVIGQASGNDKTKKNRELAEKLRMLSAEKRVKWEHVKGHSNNPMNERADRLAVRARKQYSSPMDLIVEQTFTVFALWSKVTGKKVLALGGPFVTTIKENGRETSLDLLL